MSLRPFPRRVAALLATALVGSSLAVAGAASPASAADPCGTGGNPVACENAKPGTPPTVWDIQGAGSDAIQGFATDMSVDVGGRIDFKIDTEAAAYTVDVYRTGWYGGLGARKVASVEPSASLPQHQPECVPDATTGLYDCGAWAVSASWTVPTTAVSGVYVARLTIPATGQASHITFVVRDDASRSEVLFQTSDTTWQAYNSYGGSSFYRGVPAGRAYKLSYNRPFATRAGITARDFYFGAEYPMVRFLERNGYDVSYIAGVDADRRGDLIRNHEVFLSVGHDEYWSGAQRANVLAACDAGVHLAFFSGNEMYWRTRWEPSAAGPPTDHRTLVSYKETWANAKIDPAAEWTGTWRDPRLASTAAGAGTPENALTGTMYMSNFSDLPVTVSAAEGRYRLWRHTSLASLASGTSAELAPHTVGYESNEDVDNGFRPAGLVRLSTTTGAVPEYLRDFGNVVSPGTTTHHVTLYRAASGALVFSAGSVQWSWGLDQEHDGDGAPADPRMQQATVNLLADMGVQPATLMPGLVAATASTDRTAPTVSITSPTAGAALANGTTLAVSGTASDVGGRVAGVEVSLDGGATWHPATGTTSWSYSGVLPGSGASRVLARATDDSANTGAPAARSVTVSCPCTVFGTRVPATPAATDGGAYELGLRFTPTASGYVTGVRFYKGAGNTGTHTGTLWSATGTPLASAVFGSETASGWQTTTFTSAVPVTAGTTYVVSYTAPNGHYATEADAFWYRGVTAPPLSVPGGYGTPPPGVHGAPGRFPTSSWKSSHYFVDPVFSLTDTTPLTAAPVSPVAGASSVPVGATVRAVLSKAASNVSLSLATDTGAAVAGTSSYDAATRTVTFTPGQPLAPSATYRARVTATALTGTTSWTFRTAAPAQVPGARTVSLYDDADQPTLLQDADTVPVTLGVRFASSVAGTVTGVRFYKGPNNTGPHVGALWAVGGTSPLAQGTFVDESATGWQTLTFASPVRIAKDTEYVASYRTTVGRYSARVNEFAGAGVQRTPLRTAANSGQFSYADGYPSSRSSTSYMVDVVLVRDPMPLTVVSTTPAANDPGSSAVAPVTLTASTPLAEGSLALAAGATATPGTSAVSPDGRTLTFTPSAPLDPQTAYTATASGLRSTEGSTLATTTWSFTTAGPSGCPCTLFGGRTPATAASADADPVEVGVSFTPTEPGLVTGVRFYKGSGNGGTHTGTLWSATGAVLRTVTFDQESASGWQTALFARPVEVVPGTTYVVSYLAPQGHYSLTTGDFTADRTVGPLMMPAAGNGRFRYGGGFPTSTWGQANYFVDVVFTPAPPSPPVVTAQTPDGSVRDASLSSTVRATLSKAPAAGTPTIAVTSPNGPVAGTSTWDPASLTVTFAPTGPLPPGLDLTATTTVDGTAVESGTWTFRTTSAAQLWSDRETPAHPAWNDTADVQVGVRFTPDRPGTVTAVRFYKGAANTGAHTVMLWDQDRALLAQAPSTAETAGGWQTVPLPAPVPVVAGRTYTASYRSTTGRYAMTSGALAGARSNGPLTTAVPGGAYVYGTGFPAGSSTTSYGVDLVFEPAG
ncbi:DUF4082 domain-containing protein [Cellulomonas sp.]|uniref:DUF4082 domain-containing protein n=1 Tax=Cellulomonas sp. TaxID=40001 RepID=UPI002811C289|nr:DUF4082 domain-containing protein [Cellulomonas sp.]